VADNAAIMSALCKHGYATEAWELVDQNSGAVRETEINAIFRDAPDKLDSLLGKLETLVDPTERIAAWAGLISSHNEPNKYLVKSKPRKHPSHLEETDFRLCLFTSSDTPKIQLRRSWI
jgi:hypothetical protein